MNEQIRQILLNFNISLPLERIKKSRKSNGGFPNQYYDSREPGAWATANVLLLHRKYNFLSDNEVSDAIIYLLKVYCISAERKKWIFGQGENRAFGWGSFTDKDNKRPIPIITSFVLLALCGYQNLHSRLSKLFRLAVIWLINQQKEKGHWDNKEDYYANMSILICLLEMKKLYKNSDPTLSNAIENKINKSKAFYASIDPSEVGDSKIIFLSIINSLLKNKDQKIAYLPKKIDLIFDDVTKNSTTSGENFGYEKASIIYYLHLVVLDRKVFKDNSNKLYDVLDLLLKKQPEQGLWAKESRDCIWLTCDILILLKYVNNYAIAYGNNCFFRETCNMFFKMPWYVAVWEYIKIVIKIGSGLNKAVKLYKVLG